MTRKRGEHGIIILTAFFFAVFFFLMCVFFCIAEKNVSIAATETESTYTIKVGECRGTIYDRNMQPLINENKELIAAAVPSLLDRKKTAEIAIDKEEFMNKFDKGLPFTFKCTDKAIESDGLTIFEIPVRYSQNQLASHVIGYISEEKGADGIEYGYDSVLGEHFYDNTVSYRTDGSGNILIGDGKKTIRSDEYKKGVVLTIDKRIQKIIEESGKDIAKGAIICADIKSGDILAMASFPYYDPLNIAVSIDDERCPLIDRALYSYSVGSIFKLVTAAAALEQGFDSLHYDCRGYTDISGKCFNCHKLDGHGVQNMSEAMKNSCNTYFIELTRCLDIGQLRDKAFFFGFGRENYLCAGITGSSGILPTLEELSIPAELANFSFGQGKLTATPLQITQLTCAIANKGKMPVLKIVRGLTADGEATSGIKSPCLCTAMSEENAESLKNMMVRTVRENEDSKAKAKKISVGAKTSTAQTGRFDSSENELCHAWITGFFPARKPKYAVTVIVEDGGYGNDAAAPVFAKIADSIADLNSERKQLNR